MPIRDVALFCIEIADDYLSINQKSWKWLRCLNNGYQGNYLSKTLRGGRLVEESAHGDLRLLDKGREKLLERFPLVRWKKRKWDGIWRVVMYDIPERNRPVRDKLRRWLKRMGFGQWQISVWVSPHPLAEVTNQFLNNAGLDEVCGVYESRRISGIPDREFAAKVWSLKRLNAGYRRAVDSFKDTNKERYLEMLMRDPMLPDELLPRDWYGETLTKMIMAK